MHPSSVVGGGGVYIHIFDHFLWKKPCASLNYTFILPHFERSNQLHIRCTEIPLDKARQIQDGRYKNHMIKEIDAIAVSSSKIGCNRRI